MDLDVRVRREVLPFDTILIRDRSQTDRLAKIIVEMMEIAYWYLQLSGAV